MDARAARATRSVRSVNALVGETNDGGLNDIRGLHVRPRARASRRSPRASDGPVEEGSVGAGTGHAAPSAGRAASAPRRARLRRATAATRVGVLVQTNYGGVLTMGGAPVGKELGRYVRAIGGPLRRRDDRAATARA